MKNIQYCPLCKAYHYIELFFTFTFYKDNQPIKTSARFKCTNCGKYQTITKTTK